MVGGNQYIQGSRKKWRRQASNARIRQNYKVEYPKLETNAGPNLEHFWFSWEDSQGVLQDQSDALVIDMLVARVWVHRMLVDTGSSINMLYTQTLGHMKIS